MTITGNIGKEPEIKSTSNGTQLASFSVAVRQNRRDEQGNYGTDWVNCAVFGNRVSTIQQYFHKGSKVTLTGDWSLDTYTGNDGQTRTSVQLTVRDFDLPERQQGGQQQAPQSNDPFVNNGDSIDISDDDLPF